MSEKRYFKIEYDEEWYLFDSTTISEQLVKEQAEYGYGVFANSLSPSEICDRLNTLHEDNQQLKHYKLYEDNKRLQIIIAGLKEENEWLKQENEALKKFIKDNFNEMMDSKMVIG